MDLRCTRHRTLVAYRDPVALHALGRPKCVGRTPDSVVILPRVADVEGPPSTHDPTRARALAAEAMDRGRVVVVAVHVDDLPALVDVFDDVDAVRLIWNPADAADARVERTIRLIEFSPLARAVGPDSVYFTLGDRPVSGHDWRRAVNDPVLCMMADIGRRRRVRAGDPFAGGAALQMAEAPTAGSVASARQG